MSDKLREGIAEKVYEASWCWTKELKWEYWKDVPIDGRAYWYDKANQIIALIVEGLKKQIDIKREYAFGESLFGSLEHQERMQATVNTYDTWLKLIKDIGGKE